MTIEDRGDDPHPADAHGHEGDTETTTTATGPLAPLRCTLHAKTSASSMKALHPEAGNPSYLADQSLTREMRLQQQSARLPKILLVGCTTSTDAIMIEGSLLHPTVSTETAVLEVAQLAEQIVLLPQGGTIPWSASDRRDLGWTTADIVPM